MNKAWSELNKTVQTQINREGTFHEGVAALLELRKQLFGECSRFKEALSREDFHAIPFINADGYHSKTIAYSIWHIFRIEDIVAHTLIQNDTQIFRLGNYQKRTRSPIATTGNELVKQQIAEFSAALDLDELYSYAAEVMSSTDALLEAMDFSESKRKMSDEDRERLRRSGSVSDDEKASWLIDYWCGKDVRGLIRMPFSRHWIMHVEAALRIERKLHPVI